MGLNVTEFETFEQELIKLIEELQTVSSSECRVRECLRAEAARAEAAEASRQGAARAEADARGAAAAAAAGAAHASALLAGAQDELAATKMQFELAERHRVVLEEKCSELTTELQSVKRELEQVKALQATHSGLQRQYQELQERVHAATADARSLCRKVNASAAIQPRRTQCVRQMKAFQIQRTRREVISIQHCRRALRSKFKERAGKEATRLEAELRKVEKCATGGAEIRERARLAAAAHVRERRLAAAELKHTSHELHKAKAEATKLGALVAELQCRLAKLGSEGISKGNTIENPHEVALSETRAALEAERAGAARLERALAAAVADNATLAAKLNAVDNPLIPPSQNIEQPASSNQTNVTSINVCPIDSFLAD